MADPGSERPAPVRTGRLRARSTLALASVAALAAGVALGPTAAGASGPSGPQGQRVVGPAAAIPASAVALGAVPGTTGVHVDVVLSPRDPAALRAFVAAVSDPSSPDYGHYLAKGTFATRFGPTAATVAALRSALDADGLSVGSISTDGLILPVSGSAAQIDHAFSVGLERYRLASGRTGFANPQAPTLPASAATGVVGVAGLSDLTKATPELDRATDMSGTTGTAGTAGATGSVATPATAGPTACATATKLEGSTYKAFAWTQVASTYGFSTVYGAGHLGQGETVALFELARIPASDITTFRACFALPSTEHYGTVTPVDIDGGAAAKTPGQIEVILDIEDLQALAPEANVLVYNAQNTSTGLVDEYQAMVAQDRADVISTSWGECEPLEVGVTATTAAENEIFEQAAAQGQSVFSAAGDSGSADCYATSPHYKDKTRKLAVDDPASQPYVTGVGGTTLSKVTATDPTESVWHDGGGGVSSWWSKPAWQATGRATDTPPEPVPTPRGGHCLDTPTSPSTKTTTSCRQVPDVSANANPDQGGDVIYCYGATVGTGTTDATYCKTDSGWVPIGGTSDAAPLWAAATTLAAESCATTVGFVNPRLYQLGRTQQFGAHQSYFHDITTGTNATDSTSASDYDAGVGYDNASGWGTPKVADLLSALCPQHLGSASVSLTSTTAGNTTVTYTVLFHTSATGALVAGDTVTVLTPAGTVLPSTAGDYTVHAPGTVAVSAVSPVQGTTSATDDMAVITLGAAVSASTSVTLVITHVTNTTVAGSRSLSVVTTTDADPVSAPFTIRPGTPTPARSSVSVQTPSPVGHAVTVTVTLKDKYANPVPGQRVTLTAPTGVSVSPHVPTHATTSSTGAATFTIRDTAAQTVRLSVTDTTTTAQLSKTVTFEGTVTGVTLTPNPQVAGAAGTATLAFTTSVVGALSGTTSKISLTGPGGAAGPTWPTSPADYTLAHASVTSVTGSGTTGSPLVLTLHSASYGGSTPVSVHVAGLRPPTQAGVYDVVLHTSADLLPATSATVAVGPAPPSTSTSSVVASGTSVTVGTSLTVTVTDRDAFGNPETGRQVTLDTTGPGKLAVTPSPATASATGTATFTVTGVVAGAVSLSATATHTTLPGPTVTVVNQPSGYDLVGSDGGVFVFSPPGTSGGFFGSLPGIGVHVDDVVGMVPTVDDQGYFLVGSDGGVFAFGNAPFLGSLPGLGVHPAQPITGIVAADTDRGYFLVGRDGGVYAFGTVPFLGSLPGEQISVSNIIGIASTPSGSGYWLVSATGTVYNFGAAQKLGTATGTSSPVSAIAGTPTGAGYWITTDNGGVSHFGTAGGFGTLPSIHVTPNLPIIGIVRTQGTGGYWLIGADGGIFAFGDAGFVGSLPTLHVSVDDIVGAVPVQG